MKYFNTERVPVIRDGEIIFINYKEFPHLNDTCCYYLNNFFVFDYDTDKYDKGVFKLTFPDGEFVVTSTKRSFRGRLSEIVSDATTFSEHKSHKTPLVTAVGVRLYRREIIKVSKLSDDASDKKKIIKELEDA